VPALIDQVAATGEAVLITKNGKPVAELCAVARAKSPFGLHKGTTTVVGDIVAPIDVEWEALR
jgi:antitoxin (DNA-binding transcriptional repressor) of toxin-antitoxin stability system